MVKSILKSSFGIESNVSEICIKGLPLYMTAGRKIRKVECEGIVFLLVGISEDRFGAISLEKQIRKYREHTNMHVAFLFDKLTKLQRDALVSRRIPFLSLPDQVYLPFLGIMLNNNSKKESALSAEKMMPATQALFLYLLYRKADHTLKKQAALDLGLTRTSITRASEQLKIMKLITEIPHGKEIHMVPVTNGREFFEMAKPYLINPVQKHLVAKKEKSYTSMIIAGESALSQHSMLSQPEYPTYALYKNTFHEMEIQEVDPRWEQDNNIYTLELWKYNPALFAFAGTVDPVSLAMSLKENEDERVQGELKNYLDRFPW